MSLSEYLYGIPESDPDLYATRDIDAIARRWDSKAALWDLDLEDKSGHLNDNDAYGRFIELGRRLVLDRQKQCSTGSLVDLGCGTGAVLTEFSTYFDKSIGIDISQEMLNVAASKCIRNAEWCLDDVFEGAWCRRKHIAVLSRGILLSHYGEILAQLLIAQTVKALAPGGFALFDFLSTEAPEASKILAPNKTYFCPEWLITQAKLLGSRGAVVAGSPIDRVRYLILKD
ncbi:MAG: class I SAM-dependent methyltransferase [Rhodocyclaceae bacterium]|nr:class I SAM-dependent methyltransferase [Rhodocyclaceae bacterium]MDZ4216360.1 class I SAM-dependent methyltransferase [Rhodocyclaceae bacterium]